MSRGNERTIIYTQYIFNSLLVFYVLCVFNTTLTLYYLYTHPQHLPPMYNIYLFNTTESKWYLTLLYNRFGSPHVFFKISMPLL